MQEIWFVRSGKDSIYFEDFIKNGIVAIGAPEFGEFDLLRPRPDLMGHYLESYPEQSEGQAHVAISQLVRFAQELKVGQPVMTYDREQQIYYLGEIASECEWRPDLIPALPRIRKVAWKQSIARGSLSSDTRNTLGAILTLFLVKGNAAKEIKEKAQPLEINNGELRPLASLPPVPAEEDRTLRTELLDKMEQSIEDRIVRLDWEESQELVAGILRAMGYRTSVTPRGSDRGVDIFASPDGIGLEDPRIFVEVKHRPSTKISSAEVRSFLGGRGLRDKCLYVSTGGFTQEARYEAERASIAITLLSLVDLRKLLIEYYDKMDEGTRSLIPLKRVYVLAD